MLNNIRHHGLTDAEALLRQRASGYNELPSAKSKSFLRIALEVVKEPMFILLLSCGTIYIAIGDLGEGLMLLSSVIIVLIITFYQEKRTERALEALRDLSSPRALVIRDGVEKRIAGKDVVTDDLVVLQEGDRVPADGVVIDSLNLKVDESLLTGESVSVRKREANVDTRIETPGGDDTPFAFSGTLVVQGNGVMSVKAIGSNTQIGKIGKSLEVTNEEPTLLQKETRLLVKTLSVLGFGVCLLLTILYGVLRNDWLDGILAGLSLAMAMLPEEFAVVLTIFMAVGAWRMSRKNVLTRKGAAIETLGAVTVLCVDKTGTLTHNRMMVRKLAVKENEWTFTNDITQEADETFHPVIEYAILASQAKPFDPMEQAITGMAATPHMTKEHVHTNWELVKEYPLSNALLAMSRVFSTKATEEYVVASKGSPEAIMDLCHLSKDETAYWTQRVQTFASEGLRVLGVAKALFHPGDLPTEQHDFTFQFIGLVGLEDPLREEIPAELKECYEAGMRVVMITGDYPVTAQNIARQMGLQNPTAVVTGAEMNAMNDMQLNDAVATTNIFARILPEQKLRLVEALKSKGEIVAMTGDGVNDAPALKAAHVGIAMGKRGTDVAREAAGIVLLDDNFSSIIEAVRLGRRIYDNMQKAMAYIFAVHLPIAGLTLIPILFGGLPTLMFPLHIAMMELIIDPASTLIFEGEKEEKNILKRPPRDSHQPVFGYKRILLGSMQGGFVMLLCLGVVWIGQRLHRSDDAIRTMSFTALVVGNLGLIVMNRSWTRSFVEMVRVKNAAVKWVIGGAVIFLAIVLFVPPARDLFHFSYISFPDLAMCVAIGLGSVVWFEVIKATSLLKKLI